MAKSVIYFFVQTSRQSLCDFEINNRIDYSELFFVIKISSFQIQINYGWLISKFMTHVPLTKSKPIYSNIFSKCDNFK